MGEGGGAGLEDIYNFGQVFINQQRIITWRLRRIQLQVLQNVVEQMLRDFHIVLGKFANKCFARYLATALLVALKERCLKKLQCLQLQCRFAEVVLYPFFVPKYLH
jgi:hypothetical protein